MPNAATGASEAIRDPRGVVARCEPGTAEVERERNCVETFGPERVEFDEIEQPEIVAEDRVGGVVVEEVTQVVQHCPLDAVEHVRGVSCDQGGARVT